MSKKMVKTLSVILMAIMMLGIMAMPVSANYLDPGRVKPGDPGNVIPVADRITGNIIAIVQTVAIAIAVIILIVVAVKYITAAPSDKAEVKKHLLIYVIGAVILFASTGILQVIKGVANGWFNTATTTTPAAASIIRRV